MEKGRIEFNDPTFRECPSKPGDLIHTGKHDPCIGSATIPATRAEDQHPQTPNDPESLSTRNKELETALREARTALSNNKIGNGSKCGSCVRHRNESNRALAKIDAVIGKQDTE
jgi:hypothetical protein